MQTSKNVGLISPTYRAYIANDDGEWGGSLNALDSQGNMRTLTKENIKGFFKFDEKVYALAGVSHLSINEGVLYRIDEDISGAKLFRVTLLTGAPAR